MKKKFILFCLILIVNAGFLWSFEKDDQKDIPDFRQYDLSIS